MTDTVTGTLACADDSPRRRARRAAEGGAGAEGAGGRPGLPHGRAPAPSGARARGPTAARTGRPAGPLRPAVPLERSTVAPPAAVHALLIEEDDRKMATAQEASSCAR